MVQLNTNKYNVTQHIALFIVAASYKSVSQNLHNDNFNSKMTFIEIFLVVFENID